MTITPSSDVAVLHQGGLPAEQRIADPIALFLANELFPMMTAFWPASANQLAAILRRAPAVKVASVGWQLSMRACEMQAVARVYEREHRVIDSLVQAELVHLLAELRQRGVTVTGRMM